MKILVTGSSGHLGEAICRTLHAKGINHVGLDITQSPFTTHIGSVQDNVFVHSVMKDIDYVLHTATLHKPHVVTHSKHEFINTNIIGTLNLLEQAKFNNVKGFIYTSTTSTFGDMLTPAKGSPAIWITEETPDIPKNIYGVTKNTAEDLCQLFFRNHNLPCIVLKTSRFFPEEDDKKSVRETYADLNIKANEYLYRRVDIEDIVTAHLAAIEKVKSIGFGKYIISATSPFKKEELEQLNADAVTLVKSLFPGAGSVYKKLGWKLLPKIDRVYVNQKARHDLDWQPKYNFNYILNCLEQNKEFRSSLTLQIGSKGYHQQIFEDGPYPVTEDNY